MSAAIYGHVTCTCFHYEKKDNCNQRSGAEGHGRKFFLDILQENKTDEAIQAAKQDIHVREERGVI